MTGFVRRFEHGDFVEIETHVLFFSVEFKTLDGEKHVSNVQVQELIMTLQTSPRMKSALIQQIVITIGR